jgi:hypothetical protein
MIFLGHPKIIPTSDWPVMGASKVQLNTVKQGILADNTSCLQEEP